ncbi:jg22353, partial [Pararge aegeria aegeria]
MAPVNPQMQYHHMPQQMNPHCSTGAVPNRYMHNNMQPAYPVHVPNPQMPCMMMGQPFYGGFYVYPQMEPRVPYVHQGYIQQQMPNTQPLGLSNRNYEEACKVTMPPKAGTSGNGSKRREKITEYREKKSDTGGSNVGASNRVYPFRLKYSFCQYFYGNIIIFQS